VYSAAFSPDGKRIVTASGDKWMGARIRLGRRNSANVQDARPSASAQPSTLSTQWMPILPSRGGVPLKWRAHRLCSPNGAGLFVAGDASHSWQAQMHVNATGLAYVLDSRQPYLRDIAPPASAQEPCTSSDTRGSPDACRSRSVRGNGTNEHHFHPLALATTIADGRTRDGERGP
jgi:hypothetical protein